jgi:predicted transcriptional regulator
MANKAIIGITDWQATQRELRDLARRADAGEALPQADYHLNFASAAQLFSELTPARLAVLETLKRTGAQSIYALAKRLERNYSNVHGDVQKLLEHDLVAKDDAGLVYVPWEAIVIQVQLGGPEVAKGAAA